MLINTDYDHSLLIVGCKCVQFHKQEPQIQNSGEPDGLLVMRRRLTGKITSRLHWDSLGCLGLSTRLGVEVVETSATMWHLAK